MIQDPMFVLATLLGILASIFTLSSVPRFAGLFRVVPLMVFTYFVPTLLSNSGVLPLESPTYALIKKWVLPSSLILLTLSVDLPAIFRLGRKVLALFFGATVSVILGAVLAFAALGSLLPPEFRDQAWRGLAALSGSWIGGSANMIAVGESISAADTTISMMVVVDVAVASIWMAILLYFAGKEEAMDERIQADRTSLIELRDKLSHFKAEVSRPSTLQDVLVLLAIAFGGTAISTALSRVLPPIGDIISPFTWVVMISTAIGIGLSFTPLKRMEGAGATSLGSAFLYLLIAVIGAQAEFSKAFQAPVLVLVGAVWMSFHAIAILTLRYWMRAPIFYAAVGSQANIGGAASAPVVASAFHPALAPVGVLLAILGSIIGTYGGLLTAAILQWINQRLF